MYVCIEFLLHLYLENHLLKAPQIVILILGPLLDPLILNDVLGSTHSLMMTNALRMTRALV